jgi:hypothetical protein
MANFDLSRIHEFSYYAPRLLRIKTPPPSQKLVTLHFNPVQQKLDSLWEHSLRTQGLIRFIILKARRHGISTYVEGRIFHKSVTLANTNAYIIAQDKDGLNTIFGMSKLFWEELPPYFRPMKRYSNEKRLLFENPNDKLRLTNPGLRSAIEVFSANKVTASRSGGYSLAHFSEVAFYPDAETLMTATAPGIPDAEGTVKIYESTANGVGNFFHTEWLKAKDSIGKKRRLSNFVPIFFSWLEHPNYFVPFPSQEERRDFIDTMDDEEKQLQGKWKATLEQLHWRRRMITEMNATSNGEERFHQEFPTDDIEAFIASGQPYFPRKKLRAFLEKVIPPKWVGEMEGMKLVEGEGGELKVWEKPLPNETYVIAADVGEGNPANGDPSCIEVLRYPTNTPFIEQVAEWHGWVDPAAFAGKIYQLAMWYNEALVAPEVNNHGFTTLNELKQHYYNIYQWQYFDRFGQFLTKKLGWSTNVSTRPLLCDYTLACINADILVIRSKELVTEMMTFIKRSSVGGEAEAGCHDDRVMSFMIALFVLAHNEATPTLLAHLGIHPDPIIDKVTKFVKKLSNMDRDLEIYNIPEEREVDNNDQSWLNY